MAWWGWLIVGSALLGAEMFVIDAQFYLVFLGIAALVVGLGALAGLASPEWAQWLAFAVLSVVSMLAFRRRLYGMLRGSTGSIDERVTPGERIRIPVTLAPGETSRIDYRGTSWNARNTGDAAIAPGDEAEIVDIDRLTLKVRRAP